MPIELEVAVGDVIRIGDYSLLVVESQDDEVTFKICSAEDLDSPSEDRRRPPR